MKNPTSRMYEPKLLYLATALAFAPHSWAQEEPILLDPFTVSTEGVEGYVASNSIAGTRTNTPISEIPLNIQVFTKDLAEDMLLTSQVDLERYNASMINGGDDVHSSNVIQQSYNGFLFRGFVQNWSMRDGVRNYDPVDSQGFERVEIVKGPAAALYGLTYPGGVMNTITKTVNFNENFADFGFTLASEGEYRATIDANATYQMTDESKLGIRYNGTYSKTKDHREHSDGQIEFQQINLAYLPAPGTKIEFLAENGYKELPSGLGYFSTPEVDQNGNGMQTSADIPLQITHPNIPWDWNWADGWNMRTLDTTFIQGKITQSFSENFSATAYWQYTDRLQVDSNGLNANGMGLSAASWDVPSGITGWLFPNTDDEVIAMHWHHRDWQNKTHAYGITAVYNLNFESFKNTFTVGYNSWAEIANSYKGTVPDGSDSIVYYPVLPGIDTTKPYTSMDMTERTLSTRPPSDFFWDVGGAYQTEDNSNYYYYAAWQIFAFDDRLKVNAAINRTSIELKQKANGWDPGYSNFTEEKETSPMIGALLEVTDEFSIYAVHGTSLFPTTDKNDFEEQMPPVTGSSMEFGTKLELLEGRISGTLSYYVITQEGGAQRDPSADNRNKLLWDSLSEEERKLQFPGLTRDELRDRDSELGDLVAGAERESKGFEADLVIQPTKNWQILLSYAHNENETTDAINKDLIGQMTTGTIEDQFAFVTKYTFDEGDLEGAYIGMGGQYAGEAYQDIVDDIERYTPSTFYMEIFGGYKFKLMDKDAHIRLNVKNLTEQDEYVGWKATGTQGVLATERYEVPTEMIYSLSFGIRL